MSPKILNGHTTPNPTQLNINPRTVKMSKKHFPLLQYLASGKPRIVRAIIKEADPEVMKAICECAHNVLKGNVPMNKSQFTKLKRYRSHLHTLANKKVSQKRKKKTLQTGGFLGALLGAAIPALASVIGGLIRK